jgi:hypothetical protein
MVDRLPWWVIPGALVVLARVVTLQPATPSPQPAVAGTAVEAADATERVYVREATGPRLGPISLPVRASEAFVVTLPRECADSLVQMTVWRRRDGQRENEPWLALRPRVRADATVPMVGLAAGRYDVEVVAGDRGDGVRRCGATDVAAPGGVTFALAAPGR